MSGNALPTSIDVVQLTQHIREQISRRSGQAAQMDVQSMEDRSHITSTETLGSINDEIDSLRSRIQGGEPSSTYLTLRDRLGSWVRRRLYRFLWWQSDQINALVALTLKRGREEKNVLDALSQSITREGPETYRQVLECKRQIHQNENRLKELESAQLKLQATEIERNVRAKVQLDAEWADLRTALEKLAEISHRLDTESAHRDQLATRLAELTAHKEQLATRLSELGLFTHQTRTSLSIQDRRLGLFLEEARKRLPGALGQDQVQDMAKEHRNHRYDALYTAFEDVFRGTKEEIKSRQTVYLPLLEKYGIGSPAMPLLDLGCGRGEWLALLSEHGLHARGVDRNDDMVERCQSSGLAVTKGEALPYLTSLPDASLGAVTTFHMVEHMPFDDVLALVDESLRVLKPGGILILETPNPQNILVGAHTFYLDPTHLKPLPSPMLRFFVEARGFCDAHVLELQPYPETVRFPDDGRGVANRLNDYFYGPRDYAVIGRRP